MSSPDFTIFAILQGGKLQLEALMLAASLRETGSHAKLVFAEPQPGPLWERDPRLRNDELRERLFDLGAEIRSFESQYFGQSYPQGNKIEALAVLEPDQPFVFFDTDTVFLKDPGLVPFDFDHPTASLKREGTWPKPDLYGPGYAEIWGSLYNRFGLDFESSLDLNQPKEHWERFLYFNAGIFFYRCPHVFGERYLEMALAIRDEEIPELDGQALTPWLDQIALPLVIHSLGGARDTLPAGLIDGEVTCHYRFLALLYARESDHAIATIEALASQNKNKKFLREAEAYRKLVYQGKGAQIRAMFDRAHPLSKEAMYRNRIRKAGLWIR